jgi:adenylate cyclase
VSGWLGRTNGTTEVTLLFTELCGFSRWALEVGDERALELLRQVAAVVEPCISAHGGKLVKRLGHGHMAAFPEPGVALSAALDMQKAVERLPDAPLQLRSGLHSGRPHRVDHDYLGADVNIAARLSEGAKPGEILVSGALLASIGEEQRQRLKIKRRRAFRAKGAPPGLEVFCVGPPAEG